LFIYELIILEDYEKDSKHILDENPDLHMDLDFLMQIIRKPKV
jgi:hypothetical protein